MVSVLLRRELRRSLLHPVPPHGSSSHECAVSCNLYFFFTITTEKKKKKQTNDLTRSSGKKTGCMHVHVIIYLRIHDQNSPFRAVLAAVAATSESVGMPIVAMDESWRVATKITRAAGALVGSAASFYRTLQFADRNLIF